MVFVLKKCIPYRSAAHCKHWLDGLLCFTCLRYSLFRPRAAADPLCVALFAFSRTQTHHEWLKERKEKKKKELKERLKLAHGTTPHMSQKRVLYGLGLIEATTE